MTSVEQKLTEEQQPSPPSRTTVFVTFLLFGPLIGAFTTFVLFEITSPSGPLILKSGIAGSLVFAFVVFGYLLGTLPAAITAFALLWLWRWRWPVVKLYIAAAIVGAITGGGLSVFIFKKHAGVFNLFSPLSGTVAAVVCTWLVDRWQRRRVS